MQIPLVLADFYGSPMYYGVMIGLVVLALVGFVIMKKRQG